MSPVSFEGLLALFLIFGAVPVVVLVGVIMFLKNRRHRVEEHSKLISQMIEKGDSTNLDFRSMAEALQEPAKPAKHGNLKRSVLNNLRWGSIFSFVGLGLLGVALYAHIDGPVGATAALYAHIDGPVGATAAFLTFGAIIGGVGLALLITFFVAKNYLKKETEKEEKELVEKE